MLNRAIQASTIPILEQVVKFAQARHGVLAGNLANIDTPGYHTRDLSTTQFQARLRRAIEDRDQQQSPISQVPMSVNDPFAQATTTLDGMLYHDQNNRSLEQEISAVAANQMQHNLALSIMTNQFQLLQSAISEHA